MARPLPGLRRLEHAGRGEARRRRRRGAAARAREAASGSRDVEAPAVGRGATGIGELDRVLGGGIVPGSLVLIGGSPGIGKSTLTASALGNLAAAAQGPVRHRRGVAGPGQAARGAARRRRARRPDRRRDRSGRGRRHDRGRAAGRLRHRLGPDALRAGVHRRAGLGGPGARGRRTADARGEGAGSRHRARRPRDEGGLPGRPAGARAPRRLRTPVRGRARAHLPHAPGAEEPLRLHQRGRRVRDARRRPGRGGGRLRAVRRGGHPRARLASCSPRWRARGRCSSRSRRSSRRPSSCRHGVWRTGSIATGSPSSSRCCPGTRASR